MDLFSRLDFYCERVDPLFWAEPINALTNISPFLAGLVGILITKDLQSKKLISLSFLAILTGIGSFLFHTFATVWSYWLDVIPIFLFQLLTLDFFLSQLCKMNFRNRVLSLTVFSLLTFFLSAPTFRGFMSGSLAYFPSLFALVSVLSFAFFVRESKIAKLLSFALFSFVFALIARSLDSHLCSLFPTGTHFLWHLLNGWTIFYFLRASILLYRKDNTPGLEYHRIKI